MRFIVFLAASCCLSCRVDPPPTEDGIHLCEDNTDCANGFICFGSPDFGDASGVCLAERSCSPGIDCGPGFFCKEQDGYCFPAPGFNAACTVSPNNECPGNEACIVAALPLMACVPRCNAAPPECPGDNRCVAVQRAQPDGGNAFEPVCVRCPDTCLSTCIANPNAPSVFEATRCP